MDFKVLNRSVCTLAGLVLRFFWILISLGQFHTGENWSSDQISRTMVSVTTQCDAAQVFVVRSNARPRRSVKGAVQTNAIIWSVFYWRIDLVISVKLALVNLKTFAAKRARRNEIAESQHFT